MTSEIRLFGIAEESIVDGPGIRYVIFFQGCPHGCKGCHNPESHLTNGGEVYSIEEIIEDIQTNPLLSGVTISGGEPFEQKEGLKELIKKIKEETKKSVYIYSGYVIEKLIEDKKALEILKMADFLIDGPYIEEERDLELKFRGSKNQRIIDLKEYMRENEI